ncbi:MAG: STAS/SEC14 domain-containing protein [Thermoleophilia bacterium]|nr:STAS/SEC14 domain-containing protein [Thermoleophilia bacterium]
MLEVMEQSQGKVLGFKAIGTIRPTDYDELAPMLEDLIRREGTVRLLTDLEEFKSESVKAWNADFEFGRGFHRKIEKLAIVVDRHWEKWMTEFCAPFYCRETRYFHTNDMIATWDWLRE